MLEKGSAPAPAFARKKMMAPGSTASCAAARMRRFKRFLKTAVRTTFLETTQVSFGEECGVNAAEK